MCSYVLSDAPVGKVLTGGTGEASAKQLTNTGSQYGNAWQTVPPAGYRASDTHPGPLQHAGNIGRENRSGAICQQCGAFYGELGSEPDPDSYVAHLVEVMREVWRVLRDDGTVWLNVGDSMIGSWGNQGRRLERGGQRPVNGAMLRAVHDGRYPARASHTGAVPPGLKAKDLALIPERLALALQADGWYIRSRIAWCKLSAMPESVQDRPTQAWEHLWLLAKRQTYFYDNVAVRQANTPGTVARIASGPMQPIGLVGHKAAVSRGDAGGEYSQADGANLRNYWVLPPEPYADAHFATFPTEIPRRAILAGTSAHGCCTACGAPWWRVVARENGDRETTGRPKAMGYGGYGSPTSTLSLSGNGSKEWVERGSRSTTLGWQPLCACAPDVGIQPSVVLDPFGGSGTTALVAHRLGRHGVMIELNPEYAEMARKRLESDAPLVDAVEAAPPRQLPLDAAGAS